MSDPQDQPQDENQIISERRAKLKALREHGNPFPNDFPREHLAEVLQEQYQDLPKEELEAKNVAVVVARPSWVAAWAMILSAVAIVLAWADCAAARCSASSVRKASGVTDANRYVACA